VRLPGIIETVWSKKKTNVVLHSASNFKFNNYQNCFGVFRPRLGEETKKSKTSLGEERVEHVMSENKKQKERKRFFSYEPNKIDES
jgi:hypothetical protein